MRGVLLRLLLSSRSPAMDRSGLTNVTVVLFSSTESQYQLQNQPQPLAGLGITSVDTPNLNVNYNITNSMIRTHNFDVCSEMSTPASGCSGVYTPPLASLKTVYRTCACESEMDDSLVHCQPQRSPNGQLSTPASTPVHDEACCFEATCVLYPMPTAAQELQVMTLAKQSLLNAIDVEQLLALFKVKDLNMKREMVNIVYPDRLTKPCISQLANLNAFSITITRNASGTTKIVDAFSFYVHVLTQAVKSLALIDSMSPWCDAFCLEKLQEIRISLSPLALEGVFLKKVLKLMWEVEDPHFAAIAKYCAIEEEEEKGEENQEYDEEEG